MLYNWEFTIINQDESINRTDTIVAPTALDASFMYARNVYDELTHKETHQEYDAPLGALTLRGYYKRPVRITCSGEVVVVPKNTADRRDAISKAMERAREQFLKLIAQTAEKSTPSDGAEEESAPPPEPVQTEEKEIISIRTHDDGKPMITVVEIVEPCPTCGADLYAWWETCCSDQPMLGEWSVACNRDENCYHHDYSFVTIERLQNEFTVKDFNANYEEFING